MNDKEENPIPVVRNKYRALQAEIKDGNNEVKTKTVEMVQVEFEDKTSKWIPLNQPEMLEPPSDDS